MRIIALTALLIGCTDGPSSLPPSDDDTNKISILDIGFQDGASYDLMDVINSVGQSETFDVESGGTYQIKVFLAPRSKQEQIVHDQTITAQSDRLTVGVYCSLAYNISENVITIDRDQEQVVLEIASRSFKKNVDKWSHRPIAVTSKAIPVTETEAPFVVMYHPNNMGADGFEMAVKHAMRAGREEIIATIRRIERHNGEQDGGGKRE